MGDDFDQVHIFDQPISEIRNRGVVNPLREEILYVVISTDNVPNGLRIIVLLAFARRVKRLHRSRALLHIDVEALFTELLGKDQLIEFDGANDSGLAPMQVNKEKCQCR